MEMSTEFPNGFDESSNSMGAWIGGGAVVDEIRGSSSGIRFAVVGGQLDGVVVVGGAS